MYITIAVGMLALGVSLIVISVILKLYWRVPYLRAELNGNNARKRIAQMKKVNDGSGSLATGDLYGQNWDEMEDQFQQFSRMERKRHRTFKSFRTENFYEPGMSGEVHTDRADTGPQFPYQVDTNYTIEYDDDATGIYTGLLEDDSSLTDSLLESDPFSPSRSVVIVTERSSVL